MKIQVMQYYHYNKKEHTRELNENDTITGNEATKDGSNYRNINNKELNDN
jgi:hypothetical protein